MVLPEPKEATLNHAPVGSRSSSRVAARLAVSTAAPSIEQLRSSAITFTRHSEETPAMKSGVKINMLARVFNTWSSSIHMRGTADMDEPRATSRTKSRGANMGLASCIDA